MRKNEPKTLGKSKQEQLMKRIEGGKQEAKEILEWREGRKDMVRGK